MFESNNQKLIWWYYKREPGISTNFPQHTWVYCVCVWACVLSCFSHVQLFATLWTVAHQAPLSMGFSKQAYWSGLPYPPLFYPGIEPKSLISPNTGRRVLLQVGPPEKPQYIVYYVQKFFYFSVIVTHMHSIYCISHTISLEKCFE